MTVRILTGDCLGVLATLPDASAQTCVTSPPYFGLRDYGVPGQIGLEPTPDEYVARLVAVFREVRRVLRPDGTLWLNLGDSYASTGGHAGQGATSQRRGRSNVDAQNHRPSQVPDGYKVKDLLGIPWMVAFALRADGWYLRSDIIWAKPNPMPESVTDRPTKAHEYLFLLTKSERYYYDAAATAEPLSDDGRPQRQRARTLAREAGLTDEHLAAIRAAGVTDVGKAQVTQTGYGKNTDRVMRLAREAKDALGGYYREFLSAPTRNRRSVWTVATQPYRGAHFATFPPKLIEPCILAGSSPQACEVCGAPWRRVVVEGALVSSGPNRLAEKPRSSHRHPHATPLGERPKDGWGDLPRRERAMIGWAPRCNGGVGCDGASGSGRSVVLDPFGGAGTTGLVADRLGRDAVLVELNPTYAAMAWERLAADAPLFADPTRGRQARPDGGVEDDSPLTLD